MENIAEELTSAGRSTELFPFLSVLRQMNRRQQRVKLYVRPAAWAVWTFYELSEEDKRQLIKENPFLNAVAHAQQQGQGGTQGQCGPLTGQVGPRR